MSNQISQTPESSALQNPNPNNQLYSPQESPTETTRSPLKVLVVEDDRSQWPFWEHLFSSLDRPIEVDWETTQEGAQALVVQAYQDDCPYDLVVSDVFLEGQGTGFELWNRYGEAAENFIFVSGEKISKEKFLEELNFGSPHFIQKPIRTENCKKLVMELCEHRV